ncbi:MAG: hypothetical protein LBR85_02735 [Oscillospiraceae bacterium]|jgi:hypothetical protein|nr:hypothetical protein [Oscillospiraceae bacterium]
MVPSAKTFAAQWFMRFLRADFTGDETKELYSLTEAEEELLLAKKRGHAMFVIGSKRLHVNFEIPLYKFDYFGSAGGR